jgi:hypothetical protein
LKLAVERFGPTLSAQGDERFRSQIALAAAVSGINVTFEDATLEQRRRHLLTVMEKMKERARLHDTDRRAAYRAGAQTTGTRGGSAADEARRSAAAAPRERPAAWVHMVGTRPIPPPQSLHSMRNLSDVPLLGDLKANSMLLPRDVHDQLGEGRSANFDPLRRGPSAGSTPKGEQSGWSEADRYIAERRKKRLALSDIPNHERHVGIGLYPFAGLRTVDGQTLALFKTAGGIGVLRCLMTRRGV